MFAEYFPRMKSHSLPLITFPTIRNNPPIAILESLHKDIFNS